MVSLPATVATPTDAVAAVSPPAPIQTNSDQRIGFRRDLQTKIWLLS